MCILFYAMWKQTEEFRKIVPNYFFNNIGK